jgi:hypothetical protein
MRRKKRKFTGGRLAMLRVLVLLLCCLGCLASQAAGVPIAVFPLQDLGDGRDDVNLSLSRVLNDYLAQNGNEIIDLDTVITFMANNRIRRVGLIESFDALKVRDELRAGFVLLGTVTQRHERPEPTLAITLSLVRTTDARTIWSYAGSVTTSDERKALGIGEPISIGELQYLLLDEMFETWPWQRISEVQDVGVVNIDTVSLTPKYVRPGDEVNCRLTIGESWPANLEPRIFFKVQDQIYPATVSGDGRTIEGTWVAGEKNARSSVFLLLEWAQYGRTEAALLGSYLVDGTPPLLEVELRGGKEYLGRPVFDKEVVIVPKMIVPKLLARWQLVINYQLPENDEALVGKMDGQGNFPASFVWKGLNNYGDGSYVFTLKAWDKAGNSASASILAEYSMSLPQVELSLAKTEEQMIVGVEYASKVPLRYWRLEMWTKEGRLVTEAEGSELPVKVEFKPPGDGPEQEITGFVFLQDALGKHSRTKVQKLLPELKRVRKKKEEKPAGVSENWVDEF